MVYFRGTLFQDSYPGIFNSQPESATDSKSYTIREIEADDAAKRFSTGEPLMDRYTLGDYYRWSTRENSLVIVLDYGGEIAAACHMLISENRVTINMLARNRYAGMRGSGSRILDAAEDFAASNLGIHEIRLEALDRENLVNFYLKKGYVMYREPFRDREWGFLCPMVKRIASGTGQALEIDLDS